MTGPSGYPDWQRVSNWDGPVAKLAVSGGALVSDQTPIFDVSRYAYLGGYDTTVLEPCGVQISWFADSAGVDLCGARRFALNHNMTAAQYRLPNLGPYCQLVWSEGTGGAFQHRCVILPTNRFHPLEFVPANPQLLGIANQNIANNVTNTLWPSDYYAGPARVAFTCGTAGLTVTIQSIDSNGNATVVDSFATPAGRSAVDTVLPSGAVNVQVQNTTGAAVNYYLSITQSQTGSL